MKSLSSSSHQFGWELENGNRPLKSIRLAGSDITTDYEVCRRAHQVKISARALLIFVCVSSELPALLMHEDAWFVLSDVLACSYLNSFDLSIRNDLETLYNLQYILKAKVLETSAPRPFAKRSRRFVCRSCPPSHS